VRYLRACAGVTKLIPSWSFRLVIGRFGRGLEPVSELRDGTADPGRDLRGQPEEHARAGGVDGRARWEGLAYSAGVAGHIERFHPQAPKELDRYLIPTEKIIFLIRRHWIVLAVPALSVVAGLFIVATAVVKAPGNPLHIVDIAIWLWIITILWFIFAVVEWHHELFLATDRRLMLVHGLATRKVDIMPMSKVTDMRYDRTFWGMILGYGVYILESAGQDQALSRINFISDPDLHYQQISTVIFATPQRRLGDKMVPASTGSKVPISEPEQAWWRRS
jgi:hypothetical protein